MPKQYSEK